VNAGSNTLPAGPRAEAAAVAMMAGMPAWQPRPEIPTWVPGRDRAAPLVAASDAPDRAEIAADPDSRDPLAGTVPDTARFVREAARGGPLQEPRPDQFARPGVLAATEGTDPAGGGPFALEPSEAVKAADVPAQAQADPPRAAAVGPASPSLPVPSGTEVTVFAVNRAAQATAALPPEADKRGDEPPEPALLAPPAASRSAPAAIAGGDMSSGHGEAKPDAPAAHPSVPTLSLDPVRSDPLPEGASSLPGGSGLRSPDDGAGSGAPLPAQDQGRSVAMQLAAAVSVDRQGTFEIRLSPEELGVVKLTLQIVDGTVALAIEAERPETLELMRRSLDVLEREFRDAGFTSLDLSFGHRGSDRPPEAPAAYATAVEDRPTQAEALTPGHGAPMPRLPSSKQLDLRL
jgi:hypothetical protein